MGQMNIKLVRDKIPQIIKENNQEPHWFHADQQEYRDALFTKMQEELQEFIENPCMEEAADMFEVWLAIVKEWNMLPIDVTSCANKKRLDRGGFNNRVMLIIDDEELSRKETD